MQIDIREENAGDISEIKFWESKGATGGDNAYLLENISGGTFAIKDEYDSVFIESKQHALNLIKALNKAIDLGWVK